MLNVKLRHLGSSVKSKIRDHIIECNLCNKKNMDSLIHHFNVIKKCLSNYDCKIYEALLIKIHQPKLYKQPYENGSSFLLQLFSFSHVICIIIFSLFFFFFSSVNSDVVLCNCHCF